MKGKMLTCKGWLL